MNMRQAPSEADEEILEEREDPLPLALAEHAVQPQPALLLLRILRLHHNSQVPPASLVRANWSQLLLLAVLLAQGPEERSKDETMNKRTLSNGCPLLLELRDQLPTKQLGSVLRSTLAFQQQEDTSKLLDSLL